MDSIEHGRLMDDDSIATLKKNGTYLVPTLYLIELEPENLGKRKAPDYIVKKMQAVSAVGQANGKKAFAAGVKIALAPMPPSTRTASMPTSSPSTYGWA